MLSHLCTPGVCTPDPSGAAAVHIRSEHPQVTTIGAGAGGVGGTLSRVLDDISDLVFRPALRAAGFTDDELRRMRAQARLTVVRRGAYVPSADPRLDDAVARHALSVRAAIRTMSADAVVSHVSAAALHGLVLWNVELDRVHVTRDRAPVAGARRCCTCTPRGWTPTRSSRSTASR